MLPVGEILHKYCERKGIKIVKNEYCHASRERPSDECLWLDSALIHKKRELAKERNAIFLKYFHDCPMIYQETSYYQWLILPEFCSGQAFESASVNSGVRVYGAERFSVGGQSSPAALRIATSSPKDTQELENALHILRKIYANFSGVKQDGYAVSWGHL